MSARIHWGDGYIRVTMPVIPAELTKQLRYWHRALTYDPAANRQTVSGDYRNLYEVQTIVNDDQTMAQSLLTLPGFMHRIKAAMTEHQIPFTVIDERTPFPTPNIEAALQYLRDYQWEGAYTALMSGGGVIACPTGWGKCVSPSTAVLYADGSVRKMETAAIGDQLMGDDSAPRTVLARYDGFGPMYRITPLTGDPIEVAEEHVLSLVKSGYCKRDKYPDGHVVAITVSDYLKASTTFKHRHKLYRVGVEFPRKAVSVDPYWLGLWLGDGSWQRPTITNEDSEIIAAIREYAAALGLRYVEHKQDGRTRRYSIVGGKGVKNTLLRAMRAYGLTGSGSKRIPREFLINDRETRLQLLAGLLDSDGSLNAGTDFDFVGTNKELVGDVELLARTLGFRVRASMRKCTGFDKTVDAWRLRITGPTHLIPTKVARKRAKPRKQQKNWLRTGFKIERIADGPWVGVQLDGNQLHVLGDCTVTHNTHMIGAIVRAYPHEELCARDTCQTIVTCAEKEIAAQNYETLKQVLPGREVGLIMSGTHIPSDDVQVITLDSMHRINPDDVGLLIVDEVHTAATPSRSESIIKCRRARIFGASATPTGRFDGGDLLTEGMVAPVVYHRTYQQGVEDGALVPIKVFWINCPEPHIGMDRYNRYKTRRGKYNQAVIHGRVQNTMTVELLKRIPNSMQTLCIMQQTAQMNELVELDDSLKYVHAKTTDTDLQKAGQRNLTGISTKERKQIYDDMRSGKIRKILATHVYKQGVNFPDLEVMVCPGGGGSEIVAGQIPGRGSRKVADKDCAYLIDFWHPWDLEPMEPGETKPKLGPILRDDRGRDRVYEKLGFERHWIDSLDQLPWETSQT